jgi:hypothetical protein
LVFRHVVHGILFGAIFATLYNLLPGTRSFAKGALLSLFLCIVAAVETIHMTPGWPIEGVALAGSYYSGQILLSSSLSTVWPGIISASVSGTLTAFPWDRSRARKLTEERNGKSLLLIGFILGLAIWIVIAVPFLLALVVNKGIPAVQSEFWWSETLLMSTVFLGLPGSLLVRAAWKKTKVDKSGLRWGVAGGVLMALTRILLLPRCPRHYWRSTQPSQTQHRTHRCRNPVITVNAFIDASLIEEYNSCFPSLKEGKRAYNT